VPGEIIVPKWSQIIGREGGGEWGGVGRSRKLQIGSCEGKFEGGERLEIQKRPTHPCFLFRLEKGKEKGKRCKIEEGGE